MVYYNEIDPYAAQWLRNLIAAGELPDGYVDERDIRDVRPADLDGYVQCHFFAGIGGWSLALRLAGWPDDEPVWTGSCPCQPFSAAGKHKGKADDRHLWPEFRRLITECAPRTILGEQVASKDGLREWWLAGVRPDLEARGYECGELDLPAACLNAPHQRQRLWWVAIANGEQYHRGGIVGPRRWFKPTDSRAMCDCGHRSDQHQFGRDECLECSCLFWLGHTTRERREGLGLLLQPGESRPDRVDIDGAGERLGDASGQRLSIGLGPALGRRPVSGQGPTAPAPSAHGGAWDDYDLVWCREPDGTLVQRRLESGLAPLVDGHSFVLADGRARTDAPRSELIKGLGNALVLPLAAEFVASVLECVE